MLEIVLIDKYDEDVITKDDKLLIKQRLSSLMSPLGMDNEKTTHQQLKLIDSYLMDESGKATLKSAINLVKPLYFQYVDSLLTEAGENLQNKLMVPDTYTKVILYYYFNKMNPGMEHRPAFQKLWNYSKQR